MDKQDYQYLKYFFSAYFSQIWVDEVKDQGPESYKEIVNDFIQSESSERIKQTAIELSHLVEEGISEENLKEIITIDLRANVYPPNMGLTYQQWLESVLQLLQAT